MPAFAKDRGSLNELSEALHGIANLVQGWPTNAPGEEHVQIIDLRNRFESIYKALKDSADNQHHDLTRALVSMAADLRGAADDLHKGASKGPPAGSSRGR